MGFLVDSKPSLVKENNEREDIKSRLVYWDRKVLQAPGRDSKRHFFEDIEDGGGEDEISSTLLGKGESRDAVDEEVIERQYALLPKKEEEGEFIPIHNIRVPLLGAQTKGAAVRAIFLKIIEHPEYKPSGVVGFFICPLDVPSKKLINASSFQTSAAFLDSNYLDLWMGDSYQVYI